jgi:hypothetical protein
MGRKPRRKRGGGGGGGGGGGALSSLRGGFKGAVRGVTGTGAAKPSSGGKRWLGNLLTIALLIAAVVLLLRRFGVIHF